MTVYRKDGESIDRLIRRWLRARNNAGIPASIARHKHHVSKSMRRKLKSAKIRKRRERRDRRRKRDVQGPDTIPYTPIRQRGKDEH